MESGLAQEAGGKGVRSVLRATDKNMQASRRIVIVIGGSRGKTEARISGRIVFGEGVRGESEVVVRIVMRSEGQSR